MRCGIFYLLSLEAQRLAGDPWRQNMEHEILDAADDRACEKSPGW
jgi:hypothetical protein